MAVGAVGWVVLLLMVSVSWAVYKTIKEPHPKKALQKADNKHSHIGGYASTEETSPQAVSQAVKNHNQKLRVVNHNTYGR